MRRVIICNKAIAKCRLSGDIYEYNIYIYIYIYFVQVAYCHTSAVGLFESSTSSSVDTGE